MAGLLTFVFYSTGGTAPAAHDSAPIKCLGVGLHDVHKARAGHRAFHRDRGFERVAGQPW